MKPLSCVYDHNNIVVFNLHNSAVTTHNSIHIYFRYGNGLFKNVDIWASFWLFLTNIKQNTYIVNTCIVVPNIINYITSNIAQRKSNNKPVFTLNCGCNELNADQR